MLSGAPSLGRIGVRRRQITTITSLLSPNSRPKMECVIHASVSLYLTGHTPYLMVGSLFLHRYVPPRHGELIKATKKHHQQMAPSAKPTVSQTTTRLTSVAQRNTEGAGGSRAATRCPPGKGQGRRKDRQEEQRGAGVPEVVPSPVYGLSR